MKTMGFRWKHLKKLENINCLFTVITYIASTYNEASAKVCLG